MLEKSAAYTRVLASPAYETSETLGEATATAPRCHPGSHPLPLSLLSWEGPNLVTKLSHLWANKHGQQPTDMARAGLDPITGSPYLSWILLAHLPTLPLCHPQPAPSLPSPSPPQPSPLPPPSESRYNLTISTPELHGKKCTHVWVLLLDRIPAPTRPHPPVLSPVWPGKP